MLRIVTSFALNGLASPSRSATVGPAHHTLDRCNVAVPRAKGLALIGLYLWRPASLLLVALVVEVCKVVVELVLSAYVFAALLPSLISILSIPLH